MLVPTTNLDGTAEPSGLVASAWKADFLVTKAAK